MFEKEPTTKPGASAAPGVPGGDHGIAFSIQGRADRPGGATARGRYQWSRRPRSGLSVGRVCRVLVAGAYRVADAVRQTGDVGEGGPDLAEGTVTPDDDG
jgi:hypothetical protein